MPCHSQSTINKKLRSPRKRKKMAKIPPEREGGSLASFPLGLLKRYYPFNTRSSEKAATAHGSK
jgi:hypothetical protein